MAQFFSYQDKQVSIGDTVAVHQEIAEGTKKRVQIFEGVVIATGGMGIGKTFTVRKIASNNIPVEKIFPIALPSLKNIEVKRQGAVRRSKLYYLRGKVGRSATRIKEKSVNFNKKAAQS